jgi:hypothetical protein
MPHPLTGWPRRGRFSGGIGSSAEIGAEPSPSSPLKQAGAKAPYFAFWVATPELLERAIGNRYSARADEP